MLRWALMSTVIGLVVLFLISLNSKADEIPLAELENIDFGTDVKIVGAISKVNSLGKISLIEVVHPESTDIVVFLDRDTALEIGDFVEIIGEVREFKGEHEIIADKISKLE